jgi:hypothetical protein
MIRSSSLWIDPPCWRPVGQVQGRFNHISGGWMHYRFILFHLLHHCLVPRCSRYTQLDYLPETLGFGICLLGQIIMFIFFIIRWYSYLFFGRSFSQACDKEKHAQSSYGYHYHPPRSLSPHRSYWGLDPIKVN